MAFSIGLSQVSLRQWEPQGKTLLWIKGPQEPFSERAVIVIERGNYA